MISRRIRGGGQRSFSLLPPPYPSNQQLLHETVLTCRNIQEIQDLVQGFGEALLKLTRTVNGSGRLPFHLVSQNPHLTENKKTELRAYLLDLASIDHTPPISQPIRVDAVLKKYQAHAHQARLMQRLQLSCEAANAARLAITFSNTHPQYNRLSEEEQSKHTNLINFSFRSLEFQKNNILFNATYTTFNATINNNILNIELDINEDTYKRIKLAQGEVIKAHRTGNCGEFATLVYNQLQQSQPSETHEIFHIKNGDHVFVVSGRSPASTTYDPSTWGENAIIIDAWSGKVCMAADFYTDIKDFRQLTLDEHDSGKNILIELKKNYHLVQPEITNKSRLYFKAELDEHKIKIYQRCTTPQEKLQFCLMGERATPAKQSTPLAQHGLFAAETQEESQTQPYEESASLSTERNATHVDKKARQNPEHQCSAAV